MPTAGFDSAGLDAELREGGLPITGCSSDGRVDWLPGHPTPEEEAKAQRVLVAHDPRTRGSAEAARLAEARDLVARFDALDAAGRGRLLRLVAERLFGNP